jgi:Fe-S cluster assembly protein SufD
MSAPALTAAKSITGSFTAEAFAAHLAAQKSAPAWWLDRKRAAYERFAALPMPKRTDESWRFSNISTLTLDGFERGEDYSFLGDDVVVHKSEAQWEGRSPARPLSKDEAQWHATAQRFRAALQAEMPAMPNIPALATLHFNNNALASQGTAEAFDKLSKRGVIITTLSEAIVHHADLLRAHFMAQPQKLGSEKFAALHAAFVGNGAFIYVPRDVEVPGPIVVMHAARGPNAAVFPHTLVIADDRAKVTVVDLFTSSLSWIPPRPAPPPPSSAATAATLPAARTTSMPAMARRSPTRRPSAGHSRPFRSSSTRPSSAGTPASSRSTSTLGPGRPAMSRSASCRRRAASRKCSQ